jgi:lipoate-protein ligase A
LVIMETAFQQPRNFFESLRSCVAYLERCKKDPGMNKEDVIDGIEERVSVMMGKVLSEPTATSYCVFRLDEDEM